jgi:hypothetical protein
MGDDLDGDFDGMTDLMQVFAGDPDVNGSRATSGSQSPSSRAAARPPGYSVLNFPIADDSPAESQDSTNLVQLGHKGVSLPVDGDKPVSGDYGCAEAESKVDE